MSLDCTQIGGGSDQTPSKLSIGRGSRPKIGEMPRESQIRFHNLWNSGFEERGPQWARNRNEICGKLREIVPKLDDFSI